jgi:hypothetical protein
MVAAIAMNSACMAQRLRIAHDLFIKGADYLGQLIEYVGQTKDE